MDKQEYKLKAEEIKALISKREFQKAVKIADEIDWTRVRSVAMLCTVSDLYKVNRRYKESKELLLMAYERHPGGSAGQAASGEINETSGAHSSARFLYQRKALRRCGARVRVLRRCGRTR